MVQGLFDRAWPYHHYPSFAWRGHPCRLRHARQRLAKIVPRFFAPKRGFVVVLRYFLGTFEVSGIPKKQR